MEKRNTHGFFFRPEDLAYFKNYYDKEDETIRAELNGLKPGVQHAMRNSMSKYRKIERKIYKDDAFNFSHGETFLKILETRIVSKGIFLLDEPEAALSPLKQISLMIMMMEALKDHKIQFILATHSPILMAFPGAALYEITAAGINKVHYSETEHFQISKTFLNDPESFLRHML